MSYTCDDVFRRRVCKGLLGTVVGSTIIFIWGSAWLRFIMVACLLFSSAGHPLVFKIGYVCNDAAWACCRRHVCTDRCVP